MSVRYWRRSHSINNSSKNIPARTFVAVWHSQIYPVYVRGCFRFPSHAFSKVNALKMIVAVLLLMQTNLSVLYFTYCSSTPFQFPSLFYVTFTFKLLMFKRLTLNHYFFIPCFKKCNIQSINRTLNFPNFCFSCLCNFKHGGHQASTFIKCKIL